MLLRSGAAAGPSNLGQVCARWDVRNRFALGCSQRQLFGPVLAVSDSILVVHRREGHRPDLSDLTPTKRTRGNLATGIGELGPMGRILVRGEPVHDIVPELAPLPGEPVVDKPGKGAFYATDLEAMLRIRGIAKLIVGGVTTEACVNTTVREANDRGFDCLVRSRGLRSDGYATPSSRTQDKFSYRLEDKPCSMH